MPFVVIAAIIVYFFWFWASMTGRQRPMYVPSFPSTPACPRGRQPRHCRRYLGHEVPCGVYALVFAMTVLVIACPCALVRCTG